LMGKLTPRSWFDSGYSPHYVLLTTPLAIFLSLPFPSPFLPFITSAVILPAIYYYAESEKLIKAFWVVALWATLLFAIISGLTFIFPEMMVARVYSYGFDETYTQVDTNNNEAVLKAAIGMGLDRAVGIAIILSLSFVSFGIFPAFFAAIVLVTSGLSFGETISQNHNFDVILLGVKPWLVYRFAGMAMLSIGAAFISYRVIAGKPVQLARSFKWILVGTIFVLFDIYLSVYLELAWNKAALSAMNL